MKKMIFLITLLLFCPALDADLKTGKPAPDFTFFKLNGEKTSLSDYKGRIVVIDFFSTWWLASRNNMVQMELIHRKYKDQNLVVLGISREDVTKIQGFVKERSEDITYQIGHSLEASRKYRLGYIPHVFIVDPKGNLYWEGEPDQRPYRLKNFWARLRSAIKNIVK